jgi:uncharacterized protein with FMN-binding domain
VRQSTKTAVGAISLGILGLSYQLGTAATPSSGLFASPTDSAAPITQPSESSSAVAAPDVSVAPPAGGETTNVAPQPSASASVSTAPSPSASKAPTSSNSASASKTGDSVESGFGPVQVKVTKVDGKITEITYLQSVATKGRSAAFPYLVQYAIQANGSNFGNISGATYTTNAFKQSLESALAKF